MALLDEPRVNDAMDTTGILGAIVGVFWGFGVIAKSAEGIPLAKLVPGLFQDQMAQTRAGWRRQPIIIAVVQSIVAYGFLGYFSGFVLGGVLSFILDALEKTSR